MKRMPPFLRHLFLYSLVAGISFYATTTLAYEVCKTSGGVEQKWPSLAVTYYINTANGPSGSLTAIKEAMTTWNSVSGSSFEFIYGGTTSSSNCGTNDGANRVCFDAISEADTVGYNNRWYYPSTGEIIDADVTLNTNLQWSTTGSSSHYDVQNVSTHEFGHTLCLEDLYTTSDEDKTMYGYTKEGETKRSTLHSDDIEGIVYLYPLDAPTGTFTVTSPNGGESWTQGSPHSIRWSTSGSTGDNVKIDLYKGGTYNSTIVSQTANDGAYTWFIPSSLSAADTYQIKVISSADATIYDTSDSNFSVTSTATITVTTPNGGESWALGSTATIRWSTSGDLGDYVKISLYKGGSYASTIASQTANDGAYTWSIASSLASSTTYKIRIAAYSDTTIYDDSDNYFSITGTGTITVISPNGSESWNSGSTQTISWSTAGAAGDDVSIYLYKGGSYASTIASQTANDGAYTWTIASSLSTAATYQVKVVSYSDSTIYDYSDSHFSIDESACQFPYAAKGGSLVAQSTGNTGYGFTQDIMYWPANCSGSKNGLNISFQIAVNKDVCPYIGIAWTDTLNEFMSTLVEWDTGSEQYPDDTPVSAKKVAYANPGSDWYELIVWYTGTPSKDMAIGAACGTTSTDAMEKAEAVAAVNQH